MKRSAFVIAVFAVFLAGTPTYGDSIPEGHHLVYRRVVVTNLDRHPNIVLLTCTIGPMIQGYEIAEVEQDEALEIGYKFNSMTLFAIERSAYNAVGGLNGIDFDGLFEKITPVEIIKPGDFTVIDKNPLIESEYYYRIHFTSESSITLVLDKRILKYNDGTPDRIEEF